MGLMYYIKRFIRRMLGNAVQDEVEKRGKSYLDKAAGDITRQTRQSDVSTSSVTGGSAGRTGVPASSAFAGFDPLASTKEQFYGSWPAMPAEVKQQMITDSSVFGNLPEDLKQKLMAIQREAGQDPNASEEEKKIIDQAFDHLAKG